MTKMQHNYQYANEKNIRTTALYADADDGNLFLDSKKSVGATKDQVLNLFAKGMLLINLDGEWFLPTTLKDNSTHVTVTVIKDSDGTATPLNFNSIEEAG